MRKLLILVLIMGLTGETILGQAPYWISLSKEVNNAVHCLYVYNSQLIAGGDFSMAEGTLVNRIAAWDGNNWTALGDGVRGTATVEKMLEYNGELYVVGEFDSAGIVKANNIAKWNGSSWSAVGGGANDIIYSMVVYNDELYVGGLFDSIGGIAASHIAKWNGTNWSALGLGIQGDNINDLYVFNNDLFVLGAFDSVENIPCKYIAKWNGIAWSNLGSGVKYGNGGMIEWEDALIVGSQTQLIWNPELMKDESFQQTNKWDGSDWDVFSLQQFFFQANQYIVFNGKLFSCGGRGNTFPNDVSQVGYWDGSRWNTIGKGLNKDVVTFCNYNGVLYCGGYFNKDQDGDHNYIARLGGNVGIRESTNFKNLRIYPNPVSDVLNIDFIDSKRETFEVKLSDITGKVLISLNETTKGFDKNTIELDLERLSNGVYFLNIKGSESSLTKVIHVVR